MKENATGTPAKSNKRTPPQRAQNGKIQATSSHLRTHF
jgi:hypothetical protein